MSQHARVLVFALILLATLRIASTWTVFNHTSDEPAHIACGLEWLAQGRYQYESQHPPLTRVMMALGPYLYGERGTGQPEMTSEGVAVLYRAGHYDLLLALARAGNLPFFWLAAAMTFLWGRRLYGEAGGVLAVAVFTMLPLVLAHAGLATTDMGLTALLPAALYVALCCWQRPGWRQGLLLGLALAGMLLVKFSSVVFFPAALAAIAACYWRSRRPTWVSVKGAGLAAAPALALGAGLCLLLIWAAYRFSFGACRWLPFAVPAPEFFNGLADVRHHNYIGHQAYLLGMVKTTGWWYFFSVLALVKTPIAVLLAVIPALLARSAKDTGSRWPVSLAWAIPLILFVETMPVHINIGLRHLLPAFVWIAVLTGGGLLRLLQAEPRRAWTLPAFALLSGWLVLGSLAAHPDYLPYFNAFAGKNPERIAVDSDLDWGQDIKRLGVRLRQLHISAVAYSSPIAINLEALGISSVRRPDPERPAPGWNAVSLTEWKLNRMGLRLDRRDAHLWPDAAQPVERVGRSILLFYFPPRP